MFTPTVLDLCEDVVPRISSRDITAGGQRQQSNAENANLSWAGLGWARLDGLRRRSCIPDRSECCLLTLDSVRSPQHCTAQG